MKFKLLESKIKQLNITKDDVEYVGVLEKEDLLKIPEQILTFTDWYWAGDDSFGTYKTTYKTTYAIAIDQFGNAEANLTDEINEVRPHLDVDATLLKLQNFKPGDIVHCFGLDWYYSGNFYSTGILFCMDSIGKCEFSGPFDLVPYGKSKLRKFVDNWWNSVKDEPQIKFSLKIYKNTKLIDTLNSDEIEEITNRIDEEIADNNWVEFTNNINGKVVKLTPEDFKD